LADPATTPLAKGDLRRGVTVKARRDGVVDPPTHARHRDEHCADRDACVRGASKDDAAEHDDDDAHSCAAADVFL
jgi:hypothetical protein